jgi:integrase
VNRELAFLKKVYNVAIADGLADANPVRKVKLLAENNRRVRWLDDDEEARLRLRLSMNPEALVTFALHTGLRQSEQFKLCWPSVDLSNGIITIPTSKHGESRHVPINDAVREILRSRPNRLSESAAAFVFPNSLGGAADARNFIHRVFEPALRQAGVANFHWRDLRHTSASRLVMAGVEPPHRPGIAGPQVRLDDPALLASVAEASTRRRAAAHRFACK